MTSSCGERKQNVNVNLTNQCMKPTDQKPLFVYMQFKAIVFEPVDWEKNKLQCKYSFLCLIIIVLQITLFPSKPGS